MKAMIFSMLFACLLQPCIAAEAQAAPKTQQPEDIGYQSDDRVKLDFSQGVTNASILGYRVKFTGQVRMQDKMAQVMAIPQSQGIEFQIQNVTFEKGTQGLSLSGWTAKIDGVFSVRVNTQTTVRIPKTIPVRLTLVGQFSVSSDQALFQANPCVERPLPK